MIMTFSSQLKWSVLERYGIERAECEMLSIRSGIAQTMIDHISQALINKFSAALMDPDAAEENARNVLLEFMGVASSLYR